MNILALEPYYGGSHRAFLDGWSAASRHSWTKIGLPAAKWKWRMRHAAVTMAEDVNRRAAEGQSWNRLFCSDMLNLAELKGLVTAEVAALPSVVYFHENQLTYPVRDEKERDLHFALTNFTTALAASQVWFNSAYHRDSFLTALPPLLRKMPDYHCLDGIDRVRAKAAVYHPGIEQIPSRGERAPGPARILWAARWEHDKNPELFFKALEALLGRQIEFRVSVVGQQFQRTPEVFASARQKLGNRVDRWGYQENRAEYLQALQEADIIVSTADHEFFGISVVEAIAAGACPLLPDRLAYPEILRTGRLGEAARYFYDGSLKDLVTRLTNLLSLVESGEIQRGETSPLVAEASRYFWKNQGPRLDAALEQVTSG
jgi:glycosyltransferase involved in cell wall biosynthesis